MNDRNDDRWPRRAVTLAALTIAAAAFLPYAGVLHAPFVFDDVKLVRDNHVLREAYEDPSILVATFDVTSTRWDDEELRPNYRPLRFLSYFVDYTLSRWTYGEFSARETPTFFFRLGNVAFHILNSLLVGVLVASLLRQITIGTGASSARPTAAAVAGLVAALLFAVHPLHTEAVTYISGRRDVLSTLFFLAAVALVVRSGREHVSIAALVGAPLLLVFGLLTKEMVITLAPAMLLVDGVRRARWSARRWWLHAALWGITVASIAVTLGNEKLIAASLRDPGESVLLSAPRYVARYLGLLLVPVGQSVDYSYAAILPSKGFVSPLTTLPALALWLGLAGVSLFSFWRSIRPRSGDGAPSTSRNARAPIAALGGLWFLGTLTPVLQFVPIPDRFAERFAYLPSVGVIVVVAALLARFYRRDRLAATAACAALVITLGALAIRRNLDWQSPLRLWTAAVEAQPTCARAHLARAHALKASARHREAIDEYTAALDLFRERPDVPLHRGYVLQALTFRAGLLAELGTDRSELLDRALADYREILSSRDTDGSSIAESADHTAVHFDFASTLLKRGEHAAANEAFAKVIALGRPAGLVGAAHYYRSKIAALDGRKDDALAEMRRAYETLPHDAGEKYRVAVELADSLIDSDELDVAGTWVDSVLARTVPDPERLHLLMRRAKILDRRSELTAAIAVLEGILRRDARYLPALVTLGGIETNRGELEAAESYYRRALAVDPRNEEALEGVRTVAIRRRTDEAENTPEGRRELLDALYRRGMEHLEKVELIAARGVFAELFEKAKSFEESSYEAIALRGLGGVSRRLGQRGDAERYFRASLERDPANAPTLLALAELARDANATEDARRFYREYLAQLPEGESAKPHAFADLAELTRQTDPNEALELCAKAASRGFAEPSLEATRGYALAALERWEESIEAFTRFLERASERDDVQKEAVRKFVNDEVIPRLEEGG